MVNNLAKKLPSSTRIHVFGVFSQTVDKLVLESKVRIASCSSSRDVIDRPVYTIPTEIFYKYRALIYE